MDTSSSNVVLEQLQQLTKEKHQRFQKIKTFNTTLLAKLKAIVGREVFQLHVDNFSSQWGQFNNLETTDAILTVLLEAVKESQTQKENKISELFQKTVKQKNTITELVQQQKDSEEINQLAEEKINELREELEKYQVEKACEEFENQKQEANNINLSLKLDELTNQESKQKIRIRFLQDELTKVRKSHKLKVPSLTEDLIEKTGKMSLGFEKLLKLSYGIPEFAGGTDVKVAQKLQTFLTCIRPIIEHIPKEDEKLFISLLNTKLREDALDLIQSARPNTFSEFEDILNRSYLPIEDYNDLVNSLITSRQSQFETLNVFVGRLRHSLAQRQEAADLKYGQQAEVVKTQLSDFAKSALAAGVTNKQLGQYLFTLGKESFEGLVRVALNMEKHVQRVDTTPYTSCNTLSMGNMMNVTTPSQIKEISPNYSKSNIICYFCKIKGHTYSECLKRQNAPVCQLCTNIGHEAINCRKFLNKTQSSQYQNRGNDFNNYNSPNTVNGINSHVPRNISNRTNGTGQATQQGGTSGQNQNNPFKDNPGNKMKSSNGYTQSQVYHINSTCNWCGRINHTTDQCMFKSKWLANQSGNSQ